jgi:ribosomal protein S1
VQVKVIGIDTARRRISLSLKQLSAPPATLAASSSSHRTQHDYPVDEDE